MIHQYQVVTHNSSAGRPAPMATSAKPARRSPTLSRRELQRLIAHMID